MATESPSCSVMRACPTSWSSERARQQPRPPGHGYGHGLVLAAVLVAPAVRAEPAAAHATLVRSDPEFGASLGVTPGTIRLEFDEEISADLSSVEMIGAKTGTVGPLRAWLPLDPTRSASICRGFVVTSTGWPGARLQRTISRATSGTVVFGAARRPARRWPGNRPTPVPGRGRGRDPLARLRCCRATGRLACASPCLCCRRRPPGAGDLHPLRRPLLGLAMAGGLSASVTGLDSC